LIRRLRSIAAPLHIECKRDNDRDHAAESRECHIALRVPPIALGTQGGGADVTTEGNRRGPLKPFVDGRCRHGEIQQQVAPELRYFRMKREHFANRRKYQQAIGDMDESVIGVAGEAEQTIQRLTGQSMEGLVIGNL